MITKKELEEFGKVEICEEKDGKLHIKITEGFSTNAMNTFKLMGVISKAVGDKYPIIDKCVTDDNLFDYILKAQN